MNKNNYNITQNYIKKFNIILFQRYGLYVIKRENVNKWCDFRVEKLINCITGSDK